MAEGVLFNIAQEIIGSLGPLAIKEIKLLWGVKDELEKLKDTVSIINDVLLDAEEQQVKRNAVRNWLKKLEDAMYEADNLLDDFSTESLRREIMTRDKMAKEVRIFFSKSNQFLYALKMGHKIKAIRERLDSINATAKDFKLKLGHEKIPIQNKKRYDSYSFVRVEEVIGREDAKKEVIERLMESNVEENVLILPIVGIGGLGKTALAQLIFNDEEIKKHFELKMWVCVSDNFDVQIIVEKILGYAKNKKLEQVEMDRLINALRNEIDRKKYLLVLDDVWNEDPKEWSDLKELLMGGARGSRILVTTRSEKVAKITCTIKPYSLRGLDELKSWSLFKHMAFEKGQESENPRIVAIGKEIVKKCVGVPLAIRTMGSLLYFKNSEIEWLSFKNNELSKISQRENDIIPTLKLSYDQLPSHLKHCFAYCSLFPKDYEIDKSTLIQLWMAQGFIKLSDQTQCLEDVGHEYFMNLLWRSFFQEVKMDSFGDIIGCKIHDLMHDLAISVAGPLITTLDDKEINIDEKTRQVAVAYHISSSYEVTTLLCKANRMRTFLYLGRRHFKANIDCDATFSSSKFLRVLDLQDAETLQNLSFIGKLKHLRYLDFSGDLKIKKLPDSITRLHNLQTLKLSYCWSLKELPRDIKKLVNLRHLEINRCPRLSYMPVGLGQLTNLQTLSAFYVDSGSPSRHSDSGGLQELGGLNKLRGDLEIQNLGHGKGVALECKAANLKAKQHLRTLSIEWTNSRYDANNSDEASLEGLEPHPNLKRLSLEYYEGSRLPSWLLLLTNLVEFELTYSPKCQYLPTLSQLPSLKYLSLDSLDAMEYISEDGDSNEFSSSSTVQTPFFPSLEFIWLWHCPNLKGWWRRSRMDSSVELNSDSDNSVEITEHHLLPSFPRLSELSIRDCPMLTSIEWIHNCKSLQVLKIEDCPILLQRYNRDTGKDWAEIAHIPKLYLQQLPQE
ncbi:putative disease resistance protein RGA4 [Alnus glutinosa]|uniref:putative disease resistance protein RGA4 n=1 Tax=Alnus glutinosa TaxID=3517 RepID=UPI002D797204|nr:putative disease resistance protein RGA4 [Alnus glutinosa]XP_062175509.1 putative disease resistance protein RGA4 [Alnus glutinosa]XP_062175510.1 putative disease resistance protein RGA4 [Alnus glutinosa]XP_062175511.1 putative disease resistance protein RGA4 [Alnus glutinosa]XP_062175512.1 putative disease resistance protein RGA4 [Alnus glutinosa]XP_062175513.1 putative disease resistance protein RGA4 [Alnus glutinosa]XP_062175514.1 putative disease resistance protein RGA4 [Alnus glutinos